MNNMNVSKLNSVAVTFMQRGEYGNAVMVLKRATSILRSSLHTDDLQGQSLYQPQRIPSLSSFAVEVGVSKKERVTTISENGVLDLFSWAFEIPDGIPGVDNDSLRSLVILYNMGLSYHLFALENGCSRQIRTAQDVYRMAMSIVDGCLGDVLSDARLLLILLALFNNMGHIHSTCYEPIDTLQCMNALNALCESQVFDVARTSESSDLFLFFEWNNAMASSKPLFALAPAA
jgi:hypothetical protein